MFSPFRRIIDLVLPPTCQGCGAQVAEAQTLCATCWAQLTFLGAACCDACAHPFDYEVPAQTLCGACVQNAPPFDRARAAVLYDDRSRDLVLGFKHADRTEAAQLYAKWMFAAGRDLVADADVIVPVPLHWTRLFARRYNQSALLAHGLGKLGGKAVLADAMVRKRQTPSQGRLGRIARARNVQGAFGVNPRHRDKLKGKRALLIDDVYTTGATLRAAAKVLKRAGCAGVDVLVLARVVRGFV
ncbi:ComF family protein [Magnetovibrio sp.]|uniref:ComF family protein n=1 Tax=Magnetovibrio sp. TaxID=2024836 RepID=UPI002F94000D